MHNIAKQHTHKPTPQEEKSGVKEEKRIAPISSNNAHTYTCRRQMEIVRRCRKGPTYCSFWLCCSCQFGIIHTPCRLVHIVSCLLALMQYPFHLSSFGLPNPFPLAQGCSLDTLDANADAVIDVYVLVVVMVVGIDAMVTD